MGQFCQALAIDNAHTVPHRALDCGSGIRGLNQIYGPNHPTPSVNSIFGKYINIFTICTIRNLHDILRTDMSYKGELQHSLT